MDELDLNFSNLVDSLLLEIGIKTFKDTSNFFRILAAKSFEDARLGILEHRLSLEYTCKLLADFTEPERKLFAYFTSITPDKQKYKEFTDNYYFVNSIFPEALKNKIRNKGFYIDCIKRIYMSLSSKHNDSFYHLSKNVTTYVKTLNIMKGKYFNGSYLKCIIQSERVLH